MRTAPALHAAALLGLVALALALGGAVGPGDAARLALAVGAVAALAALAPGLGRTPRDAGLLALGWVVVGAASLAWSRAPDATLDRLAATAAAASVFLLAAGLRDAAVRRLFVTGLAVVGTGAAAFALAVLVAGERARGPFGNPNHLAAWLLLPAGLAWVALGEADLRRRGQREAALLWFAALGVIAAGLAATGSRGGGMAAAAALAGVAVIRRLGPRRGPLVAAAAASVAALALGALPALWPEGLPLHDGTDESSAGLRWSVYAATSRVALDAGPLGVGLGAFGSVFEAYRPAGVAYAPSFAHSEPLQAFAELGVLFLGMAAATLVLGVRRLRRALRSRSRAVWGALAALLAVTAHALVDFPLHVPAVALTAAALAGLLFADGSGAAPRLGPGASRMLQAGLALVLLVLAGTQYAAVQAERRAADLLAAGAFREAEAAAASGLRARPARASLWTLAADAAEHDARFDGGGPEAFARAVEARRRAAAGRRGDAALQRRAAATLARAGQLEAAARALEEAAHLDPRSPVAPLARARLALRSGDRHAAAAALGEALRRHPRDEGALLLAALRDTADPELVRAAPVDRPTRASVLAQSGFPGEAAAELERLFLEDPSDPARARSAARLYRRAGDEAAARRVLDRAARLRPDAAGTGGPAAGPGGSAR